MNKEEAKKEIGTRRDVINEQDKQLAERIGKLDDQQVITAKAFVHGLETGKAIYKPAKPAEDKREQAV